MAIFFGCVVMLGFGLCELVEEGGGVLGETFEDIVHERLADEFAAVLHRVFVAVALQCAHLAGVQRDGNSVCSTLFHGFCCNKKSKYLRKSTRSGIYSLNKYSENAVHITY